jgi:two-component system sensor histidine kinase MprB
MSFRTRLALVAAGAVALAVVAASTVVWFVVRGQLYKQVDQSLRDAEAAATHGRGPTLQPGYGGYGSIYLDVGRPFGSPIYVQAAAADGRAFGTPGQPAALPVAKETRAAAREGTTFFADAMVGGEKFRVLTVGGFHVVGELPGLTGQSLALQFARPLSDTDKTLDRIKFLLFLIAGCGIAVAGGLGLVVSGAALAPVRRLTQTAEEVTETRDLSRRIDAHGRDELSRLATSFNTMLAALEDSARAQRQLVSDASHELRTPLTSLRTNIEVLSRENGLAPEERTQLMKDVGEQLVEMSALVAELVELARGDTQPEEPEDVRLDLVTADAIERTKRNRPGVTFRSELEETLVRGVPATIERAISNLLDNAAKWSPPGGEVEVRVGDGELVVRDHGPGIAEQDVPFIFDRFYRAPSARSMSGSGLGLAIVRQVAESQGGSVAVEAPADGGTRMRLRLPVQRYGAVAETP